MFNTIIFIILGLITGIASGVIGIGGAVIIIPALVFMFGFTQHQAQGTTLALMVPPIGILAAMTYYKNGNVDLKVAGLICIGFFIGGLIGGKIAENISGDILKKIFGTMMLILSIRLIFFK